MREAGKEGKRKRGKEGEKNVKEGEQEGGN